jgi:hypothetical protein
MAQSAVAAAKAWLDANVPMDAHLADQLLIPVLPASGGSFRTTKLSLHTTTNADVIQRFLPVPIRVEQESELAWRVEAGNIRRRLSSRIRIQDMNVAHSPTTIHYKQIGITPHAKE